MLGRAVGALIGLALGDALGMPTQMLDRARVTELYGVLDRFHPGPAENPISPGQLAGTVTDDTEQAVILGRLLLEGGGTVDPHAFAAALARWHADMEARGSLDLLGPSTLRAIRAFQGGVPVAETGRWGDTNGAAMRVAPLGIVYRPLPLQDFVAHIAEANALTHNTRIANAGAAAVGAAVSAGIDGAAIEDALEVAVEAADLGAGHGHYTPGASVAHRIRWALSLASGPDPLGAIHALVGTSVATQEAVPAALAVVAVYAHDPWGGVCAAASLGGDSDTVAAMAGAILGAVHGVDAFPPDTIAELETANAHLSLRALALDLMGIRR
ncbi:MAG: ADP-ribosylglycohydrolase family protein [Tessaracoccus sp.]|uniref:ADP-ribosylglycohydrolase family protein n=1 Tax=Tessaracoccus sp. TaxID=1971211 RepID=UPI001ECEC8FE|nr:ADP-ribosylglycohydrolase family protein [Tessaracoccus sp.]MBK7822373.1 ADP-ribosylglycohydrolase family protein [Tessaracoccus sp.]